MTRRAATLGWAAVLSIGCAGKVVEDAPSARYNAVGALDTEGMVFHLAGGGDRSGARGDAWALDLMHREWVRVEGPGSPVLSASSARVGDTIWVFGGTDDTGSETDDFAKWTVRGGAWSSSLAATAPSARREAAMVRIDEHRLILVGGNTDDAGDPGVTDAAVWGLSTADGSWTELSVSGDGPSGLQRHAAGHADGVVWVHGGYDASAALQDRLWSIDIDHWVWTEHSWSGDGPSARADHMLVVSDGEVHVWGGDVDDTDVWSFDPVDGEWRATAAGGPVGRDAFAWDRVPGEHWAVVVGGDPRSDEGYLSDVWLLNLDDMVWTELLTVDGSSF